MSKVGDIVEYHSFKYGPLLCKVVRHNPFTDKRNSSYTVQVIEAKPPRVAIGKKFVADTRYVTVKEKAEA